MERFKAKASGQDEPEGSGPTNRHGMPQLPVGQHHVENWPVLDLGIHPMLPEFRWRLTVDGEVEQPVTLALAEFMALPQVEDTSDFHCVTTWSRMDLAWKGVRLADAIALAEPKETATHVMLHAYDGYSTNISLEEALKPDVLLAHTVDGEPLPREHGGPVRVITPQLSAWKGAKWIKRIELMAGDRPGFWEERGYSMTAYPWKNDRYG
jgi:DMSO/TMAO reductase YedYZ molybdopterin-dependent catalytic subunit